MSEVNYPLNNLIMNDLITRKFEFARNEMNTISKRIIMRYYSTNKDALRELLTKEMSK